MSRNKFGFVRFFLAAIMAMSLALVGCGSDGKNGADGQDGMNGMDGMDGQDGQDGMDGQDGQDGQDAGDGVDLSSDLALEALVEEGEPLVAEITGVTVASPPVVNFTVSTQDGAPAVGLPAEAATFTFSKLVVEDAGSGLRSHWVSYINSIEVARTDPPLTSPDLLDEALQASRDSGGELVDNRDGSYTYTFATDVANVTDPVAIAWEPDLTHRAGIEIRIDDAINPDNPSYDFVPNGGSVTSKDIASDALCNNCHQRLALHGDGRFTVAYCVTCHNDQTRDQDYAENLDMAHMVHAIHGSAVRSAQEEEEGDFAYKVLGFGEQFGEPPFDFSHVTYPRPVIDCASCHTEDSDDDDENTADGNDWTESVDSLSCGGCHVAGLTVSDPDETTGLSTYSYNHNPEGNGPGGGPRDDGTCATQCHASGAAQFHVNVVAEAVKSFQYNILSVTDTDEGDTPSITFSITDPTQDPPTEYDLSETDGPWDTAKWGGSTRLAIVLGWSTDDYSNRDTGSEQTDPIPPGSPANRPGAPAQEVSIDPLGDLASADNGDGTYTVTSTVAVPAGLTGDSLAVAIEGHPFVDLNENGVADCDDVPSWWCEELKVKGAVSFFKIGPDPDEDPTARRQIVDIDKCNDCHGSLSVHGQNRTDKIDLCVTCHNSNATDIRARQEAIEGTFGNPPPPPGAKHEESIDFKAMIHAIHNGHESELIIYGFGGSVHDYSEVTYPGDLANCNACHIDGTTSPTDEFRLSTTTLSDPTQTTGRTAARAAALRDQTDDINTTPNATACYSCHAPNVSHVVNNGGSFTATQDDDGTLDPLVFEDCTTCHGPGRVADAH